MTRRPTLEVWTVKVIATAVSMQREAAGLDRWQTRDEGSTTITIQGTLDRPVRRRLRTALLTVACGQTAGADNAGYAIGGKMAWDVVLYLGAREFGNLLGLTNAGRLATVKLVTAPIRYGKGAVRAVSFMTRPVPLEETGDEGQA